MKKYLSQFILVVIVLMVGTTIIEAKKKANDGVGKMEFSEKVYDFGKIKEKGGLVSHEFTFTNKGDGNMAILKAAAECGCTRPSYSDAPVAPGKTGKVKVSYNPAGRPGSFEKVVTITNTGNPRKVRIKIRGVVVEE